MGQHQQQAQALGAGQVREPMSGSSAAHLGGGGAGGRHHHGHVEGGGGGKGQAEEDRGGAHGLGLVELSCEVGFLCSKKEDIGGVKVS